MRARGDEIRESDLSFAGHIAADRASALPVPHEGFAPEDHLKQSRAALMDKVLELAEGNQSKAARLLGVSAQAVQQYVKKREQGA